jgi:hypothetical protein
MILKEIWYGSVVLNDLLQSTIQWFDLANWISNLQVSQKSGEVSSPPERLSAHQE